MNLCRTNIFFLALLVLGRQGCLKPGKIAGNQTQQATPAQAAVPATAGIYGEHVRATILGLWTLCRLDALLMPDHFATP